MAYTYEYPRPSLTVDCVIFGKNNHDEELKVLLIQRKNEPFQNQWAFPGGFIDENEPIEKAALRELKEETKLENVEVTQFYSFGNPERDPRGWTVSIAHYAIVNIEECHIEAADDAKKVDWFALSALPVLAFDHEEILEKARQILNI